MEQVLVVERAAFFGGDWPQGFLRIDEPAAFLDRLAGRGFFAPRPEAEDNPGWKQPIPYCLIQAGDEILMVQRTKGQTERRLRGLASIGLGGHVEPADLPTGAAQRAELFDRALRRELAEELVIPGLDSLQASFLGLLNDDSNAVGRVHVGLVYRLRVGGPTPRPDAPQKAVRIRETGKMTGGFRSLVESADLWQDRRRFETWSQVVLEALVIPETRRTRTTRPVNEGTTPQPVDQGREDAHG